MKLDLVSMARRSGRKDVGIYFTNYSRLEGWRFVPGWLDGREVLAVFTAAGGITGTGGDSRRSGFSIYRAAANQLGPRSASPAIF